MTYNKFDDSDLEFLKGLCGEDRVTFRDAVGEDYCHDELGGTFARPDVRVQVVSTEEVSKIMAYASERSLPVTVRGSGTGLVGGAVPLEGGILLDTSLMTHFIELDEKNMTLTLEPGVLLMDVAKYVEEHGLFYPPDPGEKTATIGGNISTNAGGMRAVKYGVTRDYVRGLEVVLPSGEVIELGGKVVKNSSGYALKDMIVGSEGTLGVVTKATLRLLPLPKFKISLLVPFPDLATAIKTVPEVIRASSVPTAVEFMEREVILAAEKFQARKFPDHSADAYLLLTFDGASQQEIDLAYDCAAKTCLSCGALDVFISDTQERNESIWSARGAFLEAIKASTTDMDECDVVVPRAHVAEFVLFSNALQKKYGVRIRSFGHAGDGNLHIYVLKDDLDDATWKKTLAAVFDDLYAKARSLKGQVSGEHGIGFAKKPYLAESLPDCVRSLMRGIKHAFDPKGILNPGKVVDACSPARSVLLAAVSACVFSARAELGDVRVRGYVGERIDAMIERHVASTDVDYITSPFQEKTERNNWWQTEFWGKYMHSAVPYRDLTGSEKLAAAIDFGLDRILGSQEASGYIGNYPDDLRCGEGWDVWGMKYTMMGLLHYYDGSREKSAAEVKRGDDALSACRRLCDYVIAEIGPNGKRGRELWQTGNWCGYASSSILEPVAWLYNRTKEQKYLDFATYVVRGMTEPESGPRLVDLALKGVSVADRNGYGNVPETHGGYVMKHNRWKAYEMMSCYQGLLEYYQVTGRKELFDAALATGNQILADEVNLAGGCASSEAWFHGRSKQHLPYTRLQETCVTTTWMRFCEKLLALTDDPKWADEIERSFYNVYLAAMKLDGSAFAGYVPLSGCRMLGQDHCRMHTDCCTANGPRGALCFLREFFTDDGKTATFNFYGTARAKTFDMYSTYPRDQTATITSHLEGQRVLRLRIPAWSAKTVVKLNGKALSGVRPASYFTVARTWRLGDVVEIAFDMPVVAHTLAEVTSVGGAFDTAAGARSRRPHYVAFTRGPILLARDSRFHDGDMTEPFRARADIAEGRAMSGFNLIRAPFPEMWMAFSGTLPIGSHSENVEGRNPSTVFFCDYASAGDTWRRDNYYRTWFPIEYGPTE